MPECGPSSLHLYVALIAYNKTVDVDYAMSLLTLTHLMKKAGHRYTIGISASESLIPRARNTAAHKFLLTECSHLMFIDVDVGFDPHAAMKMFQTNADIIGGVYRKKWGDDVRWALSGTCTRTEEEGLYAVQYLPTGFLLIKREALLKIKERFPERVYKNNQREAGDETGGLFFDFFPCYVNESLTYLSEDFGFSELARKSGVTLHAYGDIDLDHTGIRVFSGNFHKWVVDRNATAEAEIETRAETEPHVR